MTNTAQIIWAYSLILTLLAAVLDWRTRRIPNWLTVPGLLLAVILRTLLAGWHGTLFALEGAGLALVLLLPLVLLRGLGAGDWKLMGAVGASIGPLMLLFVLLGSIAVSGLMAVVQMFRAGRTAETLRNLWTLVRGFLSFGLRAHPRISLDNPTLIKLPFGVAVAAATLVCFCAARWGI